MAGFVDYYRVLQVHHDASQEVVEAAYRRLCKIYHPDVNHGPRALERMKEINEAYEVVGRAERRRSYHSEWLSSQRGRGFAARPAAEPASEPAPEPTKDPAGELALAALDDFFHALIEEDWDRAYGRLTTADRRQVLLGDFREWKRTVAALFTLGSYAIKPFRSLENCRIDDVLYPQVREFSVFITDIDRRTGRVDEENVLKHVTLDGGQWRVALGYRDVRPITLRYKYLLENMTRIDPVQVYAEAVMRQDGDTGLASRKTFLERAEQEAIRSRRYGNPFSVAVLRVEPGSGIAFDGPTYGRMCVTHAARTAVANLRQTDVVGRWGNQELVILFTETMRAGAMHAVTKLLALLSHGEELKYRVSWGLADFDGFSVEDTILSAAADARTRTTTRNGVTATTLTMDD